MEVKHESDLLLVMVLARAAAAARSGTRDAQRIGALATTRACAGSASTIAAVHVPAGAALAVRGRADERAKDLKITDYEIVKVDQRARKEAQVQVKLSWYKDSEGTLHETHAMQTWERHGKAWLMVDETRVRGRRDAGPAGAPGDRSADENALHDPPDSRASAAGMA